MQKQFGNAFTLLLTQRTGLMSRLIWEFEREAYYFYGEIRKNYYLLLRINAPNSSYYKDDSVRITG